MIFLEYLRIFGTKNTPGASPAGHKGGGSAPGGGRALWACGPLVHPPAVFLVPEILKYSIKNHTKSSGHLEIFYFQGIFLLRG